MKSGPLCVLACYILWGLLPGYWKLLAPADSFYVLACRMLFSLGFMALLLAVQRKWAGVKQVLANRREWGRLTLAGVFICINWGAFIWAVSSGHLLDSSLAYYMNPVLAILIGTVIFREKQSWLQWLAVGVTVTGLAVTIISYGKIPWLALIIGGSFAIYGALKKGVSVDAGTSIFMETLVLCPFALIFLIWSEWNGQGAIGVLAPWQFPLLIFSGVITSVPLLFFAKGIPNTPMSLSGILMYINPTLQLLTGVFFYGETFSKSHAVLFAFVWTGLLLYLASDLLRHWRQSHHKEEENLCE